MRMSREGTITIPPEIQKATGLVPGVEVELRPEGNTLRLVPKAAAPRTKGQALVSLLRGRGDVPVSTDEVMRMTRGLPEDGV